MAWLSRLSRRALERELNISIDVCSVQRCADVGCDVAFGLNFLAGRAPAPGTRERWRGSWDASNAVALLR